jgi:hypothetical protein
MDEDMFNFFNNMTEEEWNEYCYKLELEYIIENFEEQYEVNN